MQSEEPIKVRVHFGTVELHPSIREIDGRFCGGGYKVVRDHDGLIQECIEWEPNGLFLTYTEPEKRNPWWKFWG